MNSFDALLAAAEARPFTGWDFSWLAGRMVVEPPGWDYTAMAADLAAQSPDVLDMGTGGGEWLSAMPARPRRTIATEAWEPNVAIAAANLSAIGVPVVRAEGAADNTEQDAVDAWGRLPFRDRAFHLIVNRHESFAAAEVARVLAPGGTFLTQQVDWGNFDDYHMLLGEPRPPRRASWLDLAVAQVEAAGLTVAASGTGVETHRYTHVGALAWYLTAVSADVGGFTIERRREQLRAVHERIAAEGFVAARETRFWLRATSSPSVRLRHPSSA